tara:strand:- start:110 stop:1309 length:1200 start_codon:yes stop_codon:yes gene_type:complete
MAIRKISSVADVMDGAKYIDDIAAAVKLGKKTPIELSTAKSLYKANMMESFEANSVLKKGFSDLLGDANSISPDEFKKIMKALPEGAADDLFDAGSKAAQRAKKLPSDAAGDAADAAGDAAKKADDIDINNIDDLKKLDSLPTSERKLVNKAINDEYAELSNDALKIKGDEFFNAGEEGMNAFKKLPSNAQAKVVSANPKLRWKAGQEPAGFGWIKGACKNNPKMCAIGAAGGLAGAGYVSYKIYDKVEKAFDDKEEEKRACIATCLPEDFYESKVGGYGGTKDYKDLTFRTIEDVKASSGDNNITTANTPLCTASMDPPKKCKQMCVERCDGIHQSFMQRLAKGAGGLARDVVDEAADVAGTGLKGFLDGFFGEGMGIPGAIGIFIFIFIFIIIVSTM